MCSRSLGELVLRPTSLSRFSFAQNFRAAPSWSTQRLISTSPTPHAAQPQPKDNTSFDFPDPSSGPPQPKNQPLSSAEQTSEAIDNLFTNISHPAFTRQPSSSSSNTKQQGQMRKVFGSNFSDSPAGAFRRRALDVSSLDMPASLSLPQQAPNMPALESEKPVYPRLNPAFGRTVDLDPGKGRDLVRGIGMLGSLMARNKVRADFMKQRFHERPGLRRKRLKSERWRARFKQGFQDVTMRVKELTRKGW